MAITVKGVKAGGRPAGGYATSVPTGVGPKTSIPFSQPRERLTLSGRNTPSKRVPGVKKKAVMTGLWTKTRTIT